MSLANSPDLCLRPEDRALKMLFPSSEEQIHNSFDEFFERELYNLTKDEDPQDSLTIIEDYLDNTSSSERTHSSDRMDKRGDSPQPWRKGLWCLHQRAPSELMVDKTRKSRPSAFISPDTLASKENFALQSPPKFASFDRETKKLSPIAKGAGFDRNRDLHHSVTREQTLSPSPMYARISADGKMDHGDMWQENFQNFHLQSPDDKVFMPMALQSGLSQHNVRAQQVNAEARAQRNTTTHSPQSPTRYHYPFRHVHRPNPQPAEQNVPMTRLPGGHVEAVPDQPLLYRGAGVDANGMTVWTAESLPSSDSSHYSHGSQHTYDNAPNPYTGMPGQSWISPISPGTSATALRHRDYSNNLAAPAPQRALRHILYHQDTSQSGLEIQAPDADEIGRAVPYEHVDLQQAMLVASPRLNPFTAYPPLPPLPGPGFSETSPFDPAHRRHKSYSRSPSPPISPSHVSSRSLAQRSPSRPESGHNRRKSIHKPGPIKDSSTSPSHQRSRSTSKAPRTPRTPRTPSSAGGFGQIDFVNFTPKDSAKLMSDVAPSGSSKTRARREQEAKDKRKRLSEAALQAVRRAGGDISALEEVLT